MKKMFEGLHAQLCFPLAIQTHFAHSSGAVQHNEKASEDINKSEYKSCFAKRKNKSKHHRQRNKIRQHRQVEAQSFVKRLKNKAERHIAKQKSIAKIKQHTQHKKREKPEKNKFGKIRGK